MKTELLATLALLQQNFADLSAQVNALPDDPVIVPPAAPTGLSIVNSYVMGGPVLALELNWDDIQSGCVPELSVKGTDSNPAGPQEWTQTPINYIQAPNGMRATYVLQNPAGQSILFRLRVQDGSGLWSEAVTIQVDADDYLNR